MRDAMMAEEEKQKKIKNDQKEKRKAKEVFIHHP